MFQKHFKEKLVQQDIFTTVRVARSDLNQHKFVIGLADSPKCLCCHMEDSPSHYFLDCFLYLPEPHSDSIGLN